MKKKFLIGVLGFALAAAGLTACSQKPKVDGEYDFIIYQKLDGFVDSSYNVDMSKTKELVRYHIEYVNCKTVLDTLVKKENRYYFNDSSNYIVVNNGYLVAGFISEYSSNEEDLSWSYLAMNSGYSMGIAQDSLEGLNTYEFVINGWAM